MAARDTWPRGLPRTGMTFYRPGEIVVLLEPTSPVADQSADAKRSDRVVQRAIARFFRDAGFPLRTDAFKSRRDEKPLSLLRRRDDPAKAQPLILQTVTLATTRRRHTHHPPDHLVPPMGDVLRAVDTLNSRRYSGRAQKSLDDVGLRVVAATPNWLASAFCW